MSKQLSHGGELEKFSKRYAIAVDDWLDLSTGISPFSYPIPPIPVNIWQRLPEQTDAFTQVVSDYYQTKHWLVCSGSQSAIQNLPKLWFNKCQRASDIWVPKVGYKEHEKAWKDISLYSHTPNKRIHNSSIQNNVIQYEELPSFEDLTENCAVIIINPNNPTGKSYTKQVLLDLASNLEAKNGLLVVDEAFIDFEKEKSLYQEVRHFSNFIILRSLGKFFGLAGLRVGFILSTQDWLDDFNRELGIWSVTGPSLYVAEQALRDIEWQKVQKQRLASQSSRLGTLLEGCFKTLVKGTTLFKSVELDYASDVHHQLCRQGILVRLSDEKDRLRFGIPDELGYQRLFDVLTQLKNTLKLKEMPKSQI